VARLAKVHRLADFDDLSLIDRYAERYSQDPNWVYDNVDFGTVLGMAIMHHEIDEYNERYQYIWQEISTPPTKTK
jgi:hypothetical protein